LSGNSALQKREMVKHLGREELRGVLIFIGVIWCVFVAGLLLPFNINSFGITPRSAIGLLGIPLMPFLHANLGHLLSNTVPLTVLLLLLTGSNAKSWIVVINIILVGGALLWLLGRPYTHVGASGLIYGLIAFLLVSGLMERRPLPLAIAILVGFLYGGTLLSGIVPNIGSHTSWEGHFFGAIAGSLVAVALTKRNKLAPR
jgi:membrane associated rhomboid family serine protease